ncbi:hypothetical protein L596_015355 [Steinernema carpocapsae]|uniref:Phosphatidylethanolamine-binding protein n=1 Tax=Steinernema carpocapsae TaxID=34508 RepID=A0A4U5NFQ9_STECR|nr:hypothetical protein L596_015355 [Steinernema carpocapsae]
MLKCVLGLIALICCSSASEVPQIFQNFNIVPDIITVAPKDNLKVKYLTGGGLEVLCGTRAEPSQVESTPWVTWHADHNSLYTLVMVDPDARPSVREWRHWLVMNIPGNLVTKGDVVTPYAGPSPPPGSGFHRYIVLAYKQLGKLDIGDLKSAPREQFRVAQFAEDFALGRPVAGNFLQVSR